MVLIQNKEPYVKIKPALKLLLRNLWTYIIEKLLVCLIPVNYFFSVNSRQAEKQKEVVKFCSEHSERLEGYETVLLFAHTFPKICF